VTPEETTSPSGDNSRFFLWIGLMGVSALAIVILLIRQRRKNSRA
jgi:LPXTG-motif cell wall-anchored protein